MFILLLIIDHLRSWVLANTTDNGLSSNSQWPNLKDQQILGESSHTSWGFNGSGMLISRAGCLLELGWLVFYFWCFSFSSYPLLLFEEFSWIDVNFEFSNPWFLPLPWRKWSFRQHHGHHVVKVMQPLVCTFSILVGTQKSKDHPWEAPVILAKIMGSWSKAMAKYDVWNGKHQSWKWTSSNFSPLKRTNCF